MVPVFSGKVIKGRVKLDNSVQYFMYIRSLEDKEICVTVKKKTKKRSNPQNAYYWSVVVACISQVTGYTDEEVHETLKWQFLRKRKDGMPDTCRSTTDLDTVEMEDFLTKVRAWASEFLLCYIPLPNEVDF